MIIDDPDAFKSWLTAVLEPLCDADPAALARYVYALVKKDRTQSELKDAMLDQLEVFLQHETKPFVSKLMKTLETQLYEFPHILPVVEANTPPREASPVPSPTPATPTLLEKASLESIGGSTTSLISKERIVLTPTTKTTAVATKEVKQNPVSVKDRLTLGVREVPGVKRLEDGKIKDGIEREPIHPLMSISTGIDIHNGLRRERERDNRKSDSDKDERRRQRTRSRSRSWERSRRSRSRDRRDRDKSRQWRNKSPPRRYDNRDGRRPSPIRARGPLSRGRYRLPPSPTYRPASRSRSRSRSRTRSHSLEDRNLSGAGTPTQDSNHGDTDLRLNNTTQSIQSVIAASVPVLAQAAPSVNQRCRDYDEKGYCMKGDLCPFDHGIDPVILQEVALPGVLSGYNERVPPPGMAVPPGGPMGLRSHGPPPMDQGPPRMMQPRNVHAEYNPDAPGIWHRGGGPMFRPGMPRGGRGGMIRGPFPPQHFQGPPPFQQGGGPPVPPLLQRELIAVPVVDNFEANGAGNKSPGRNYKRTMENENTNQEIVPKRKGPFDFNRLGPRGHRGGSGNSLELRKVPRGLNAIEHLNNHFAKFGKITNIQISYEGDAEAAVITFSSHAEANAAYRSTEAVLNNRFIKVFWHNTDKQQEGGMAGSTNRQQATKDRLGGEAQGPSAAIGLGAPKSLFVINAAKEGSLASQPNTMPAATAQESKAQAVSAIHKSQAVLAATAALRKKKEESRKEAVQIAKGLTRRKQELLQGQLKQQRLLIERLEKGDVSGPQRDILRATIKTVQESIEKLRAEINMVEPAAINPVVVVTPAVFVPAKKTKEEAQKEILDAELDLFTKQQAGQDTTALQRKVFELKAQVPYLRGVGRGGVRSVYRGGSRGTGRPSGATSVDRRPTRLLVSGFDQDDSKEVLDHFKLFGEISEHVLEPTTPALTVRFTARQTAEQALLRGRVFKDRMLSVTWLPDTKLSSAQPRQKVTSQTSLEDSLLESGDELNDLSEEILLQEEEEDEDEDAEDRSWRR